MFVIGDTVLYGSQGVCRIEAVEEKKFGKETGAYYVLRPIFDPSSTIFVPFSNEKLIEKMKNILSIEQINEMIDRMPELECIWIENETERKASYRRILDRADREEVIQLIKTLFLHQKELTTVGKRLHIADERYLKDAEKLLYDEFAFVLGIKQEAVLPFILKKLDA